MGNFSSFDQPIDPNQSQGSSVYSLIGKGCIGCVAVIAVICASILFIGGAATFIASRTSIDEVETNIFTASEIGSSRMEIVVDAGDVIIEGRNSGNNIEAFIEKSGSGFNENAAQEALDSIDIIYDDRLSEDNELVIEVKNEGIAFENFLPTLTDVEVRLVVPSNIEIVITTDNGTIDIVDGTFNQPIRVETDNGRITIESVEVDSSVRITTSNGRVEIEDLIVRDTFDIDTNNGRVEITDSEFMNGVSVIGDNSRIEFSGRIGTDNDDYMFRTDNGSVDLEIRNADAFRVQLETNNGSIDTTVKLSDLTSINDRSLRGVFNGGSSSFEDNEDNLPLVSVRTDNGSIDFDVD